ncbi:MAG: DUF1259 domain-containing protein [Burkholderiales bacterium]
MKTNLFVLFAMLLSCSGAALADEASLNTARIEQLTGLHGKLNTDEGVFKVTYPRTDIHATVAGVRMNPALGLTAWAAFERAGEHVMVMGDIVVLENEIGPVMSAALDSGLEVTALHNHFVWDEPKVMFMHIGGMGDEETLASAVGQVFAKLREVILSKPQAPVAQIDPIATSLDTSRLAGILGTTGSFGNGVYKVVFGRHVEMNGIRVGGEMGVNTWAAFAGSNSLAVVDGDFATLESELQSVLKALRAGGVNVVAIHNHMTFEQPRVVFLHYWGIGPAESLARTLRAALDTQHL